MSDSIRSVVLAIFCVVIFAGERNSFAEELLDWTTSGMASCTTESCVLTPSISYTQGEIQSEQELCAEEFTFQIQLYVGDDVSEFSGKGIAISAIDESGDPLFSVHMDTYKDSDEDSSFELDDSHISVETKFASKDKQGNPPTEGNYTFGPVAAASSPFNLKGAGWFTVTIYKYRYLLSVVVSNNTTASEVRAPISIPASTVFRLMINAETAGANSHEVRNASLLINNNSACSEYVPPLSNNELRAELLVSCGDPAFCPNEDLYTTCISATLLSLQSQEKASSESVELLNLEASYDMALCRGYDQCLQEIQPEQLADDSYNEGYTSGVSDGEASGYEAGVTEGEAVGLEQGLSDGEVIGYAKGVTDGKIEGLEEGKTIGYAEGFTAGESSGYEKGMTDGKLEGLEEGQALGFQAGLESGKAVGVTEGHETGFAEGYEKGLEEGKASVLCEEDNELSLEEAQEYLDLKCKCEEARSKGAYLSCVAYNIIKLKRDDLLSSSVRRNLFSTVMKRACPVSKSKMKMDMKWGRR